MRYFVLFIALLNIYSCSSSYKINRQNLSEIYDIQNVYLHPEYVVYHYRGDSSRLIVKISSSELLYKKNEAGANTAQATLSYRLFNNFDSRFVIDSASVILNDVPDDKISEYLIHSIAFPAAANANYILEAELTDNHRNHAVKNFINVDKSGSQSAQYFLVKLKDQAIPLFRNYIEPDEIFHILTPDTAPKKFFVRCYFRDFPLAPPPFTKRIPLKFEYAADSIFTMEISPFTDIQLDKKGFYHFQYDTIQKEGLSIFRFDEDFPKVTDADQLLEELRYITTQQEYNELRTARDKKEAIDRYWLRLAGNEQRAKVLIKNYYTRIQNANELFTSYLEGWKTDRGLIYTVFGVPSSVFKSDAGEDWSYSNFNYNTSLTFTFEKISNPFSDNDYILRRSDFYEPAWYSAVDRWRQGVIVND